MWHRFGNIFHNAEPIAIDELITIKEVNNMLIFGMPNRILRLYKKNIIFLENGQNKNVLFQNNLSKLNQKKFKTIK